MARKFGGKYSPDGRQASPGKGNAPLDRAVPERAGGRVNFLFLAPLPLLWKAFTSTPVLLAQYLAAFGLLILAAWLTREGLRAEDEYNSRRIARRPALPRKIVGSLITGLGLAVAGWAGHGAVEAAIFAVLGAVIHFAAFGPDPLRDKGAEGIDAFQSDRAARAVEEAEKHLAAMSDAILRARDRRLEDRVTAFQATVREMFRTVQDDPRDLTAARKYLSVYLMGARDATVRFADLYARTGDESARADYVALLDDLEANFAAQTDKLLLDNKDDLDVEIAVLRDRLAREGVKTKE